MPLFETPGPIPTQDTGLEGFGDTVKQVLEVLMSPELQAKLLPFKIIFIFISIGFLAIFIYFLLNTSYAQWKWWHNIINFLYPNSSGSNRLKKQWEKIKKRVDQAHSEAEWKIALLDASVIVIKFMPKDTVDQLTKDDISNLAEFLGAYQTLKAVKDDVGYKLDKKEAKDILDIFEKALKDMEVLA